MDEAALPIDLPIDLPGTPERIAGIVECFLKKDLNGLAHLK